MRFNKKLQPFIKALAANPRDEDAQKAVERFYSKKGRWPDLAKTWEHLAKEEEETNGAGSAALFYALAGQVWDEQVHDEERARECLLLALQHDASDGQARMRLRRILSDAEDWEGLTDLLEQEVAATEDPVDKAALLFQLGRVWEDRRGKPENAMIQYREAFRTDPGCIRALHAARALYEALENFEMVAMMVRLEVDQTPDGPARLDLLTELGFLLATEVGDIAQAIECFQQVLDVDPDNEEAARALEEIEIFLEENAGVLEDGSPGDPDDLPTAEVQMPVPPVDEATPDELAAAEVEAEEAPAAEEEPTAEEEPAAEEAPTADVEDEVETEVGEVPAPEDDGILIDFDDEETGQDSVEPPAAEEAAEEAHEEAQEEAAEPEPADVESGTEPEGEPEEEPEVAQAEEEAEEEAAEEAEGEADEERGGEEEERPRTEEPELPPPFVGEELPTWEEYVQAAQGDAAADAELAARDDWRGLQKALLSRFDGDKAQAFSRLGHLAQLRGVVDRAVDAWRQVAQATKGDGSEVEVESRKRLMGLYHDTEKWNAFIEIVKQEIEAAVGVSDRVELLKRMIAVYRDKLGLDHMVSQTWQQVLAIAPESGEALDALEVQYERLNRWPDLIGILQKKAERAADVADRISLNKRIARLFVDRFSNQAEAIKAFEAVLEVAPDDRDALDYLKQMYERRRDWEKLVGVLTREADLVDSDAERAEALKEVARVASERMKRSPIPAETWQAVLELAPQDTEALDALHVLYEKDKRWEPLAEILERKTQALEDEEEQVKVLQLLGHVRGDRLKDATAAIEIWRRVLALAPDHPKAQEALKRAYIEAQDWQSLTEQYAARDAHKDLVRVLESQVGVVGDDTVKVDLLQRAATVWSDQLDDDERAVRAIERILQFDEENLFAAQRLIPVYESKKNWKRLVACHEIREQHSEGLQERHDILETLAKLEEDKLLHPGKAFQWLLKAVLTTPTDQQARSEAFRLAGEVDGWEQLADTLHDALELVDDPAAKRSLDLARGRVLAEELGRLDEAMKVFDRVVAEDPESLESLSALESLYKRTGRFNDLLDTLQKALPLVGEDLERRRILRDIANVQEEHLDRPEEAVETYRRLCDEFPNAPEPLADLRRLYRSREDWPSVAESLRREIAIRQSALADAAQPAHDSGAGHGSEVPYEDLDAPAEELDAPAEDLDGPVDEEAGERPEVAEEHGAEAEVDADADLDIGPPIDPQIPALRYELAELLLDRLDDPSEAITELSQVLDSDADHAGAQEALESLLDRSDWLFAASDVLEPIYRDQGEWDSLVKVRQRRLEGIDDPGERFDIVLDMARIHAERRLEPRDAFVTYGEAFRLHPDDDECRERLEALAESLDAHGELVEWYRAAVDRGVSGQLARTLEAVVAQLQEESLGDLDEAQRAWRGVLEVDPSDATALAALERLYTRTESWNDLLDIYRRQRDLAEHDEGRRQLSYKLANLQEELLSDNDAAIETYKEVLGLDESDARALEALDRLYERQERWDELSSTLNQRIVVDPGEDDGVDLRNRLANLYETRLDQHGMAVETLREVLDRAADDALALEALERLLQRPEQRVDVARILEPRYEEAGAWRQLVDVLRIILDAEEDSAARIELLRRVASIEEERLDAPPAAFEALAVAFAQDPGRQDVREELGRLADSLDRWGDLSSAYEEELDKVVDGQLLEELLRALAAMYEERLSDGDGAARVWQRLLDVEPDDMDAMDSLQRLYQQAEKWSELVGVLERRIGSVHEPGQQRPLLLQIATLQEEMLESPEQSVEALRRVLALDPSDDEALEGLERLLREATRWEELVEILHRQAEGAGDPDDRAGILKSAGDVYRGQLEDAQEAIAAYRAVLDAAPGDEDALSALDELYRATDQPLEQLEILEQRHETSMDPVAKADFAFRIAQLWETRLDDAMRAVDGYKELLAARPGDERTLDALMSMVQAGRESQAAADVLLPFYRGVFEWASAVDVQEALLAHEPDPVQRVGLLRDVARVREQELEDLPGAFGALAKAFSQDPAADVAEELLAELERLSEAGPLWERYVELLDAESDKALDEPGLAAAMVIRTAAVHERSLDDPAGAIDRYRKAMQIDPGRVDVLASLDRLFQRQGQWDDLADVLRLRVAETPEASDRVDLLMRLGELYESALERVDDAIEVYRQVLDDVMHHPPAITSLERLFAGPGGDTRTISGILDPIYRENRDWEKWIAVQEKILLARDDVGRRQDLMREVAGILLTELTQSTRALQWYGRAFQESPEDSSLAEEMERLAREYADWDALIGVYLEAHEFVTEPQDKAGVLLRLARIYENEKQELEQAETCYTQVLSFDESHGEALSALDRLYTMEARWADLADVLRRRIAAHEGEPEGVELLFRLAHLLENELGDLDMAVVSYSRILELDPDHEGALKALESIYLAREEWEALFGVYEGLANIAEGDEGKAEIYARMANLAAEHLQRPSDAIFIWNKVVEMLGEDQRALASLANLHEREEQWDEHCDVLERLSQVLDDPEEEADILTRLGSVLQDRLERTEDALDCWRRVNAIRPDDVPALDHLRRLYRETGQHIELAEVIEQLIDARPEAMVEDAAGAWADLYADLGRVRREQLHDPEGATESWRQVVALRPDDLEALTALESLHTDLGEWASCADVLQHKASLLVEPSERVGTLLRVAAIVEERLEQRDRAVGFYEQVAELDPGDMEASVALERLYIEDESHEKLLNLLLTRLEVITDDDQRMHILRQAAGLCEAHLESPEKAFFCLAQAWQGAPADEDLADEMERLARVAGHAETLLDLYEGVLPHAEGDLEIDLHRRIGRVYSGDLGAFEEAISHLEKVKAGTAPATPERADALSELEALYDRAQRWDELVAVLSEKLAVEQDPVERTGLLNRVGYIWEDRVGDHDRALEVYREVLRQEPGDDGALSALERIHTAREEWRELIDVLSRRAETTSDPDAVVRHRLSIALLWESALGVPERAVEAYREVLFVEPGQPDACTALENLYVGAEKWQELTDVYRSRLAATQEEDERASLHIKLALVLEEQFADLDSAIESYEQVLVGQPDHLDTIRALERLYIQVERWEPLLETYEKHLDAIEGQDDVETSVSLLTAMARVYHERLESPTDAAGLVRRVLSLSPGNTEALDMLARLHEAQGDWAAVVDTLKQRADIVPEPDERAHILARIGRVVLDRMEDEERAVEQFYAALDHDPRCAEAMDALADIYAAKEDWQNVVRMLKRKEEITLEVLAKAAVLHRVGSIYQAQLEDAVAATDYFERSVALDSENVEAAQPLVEMYLYEKKWERAEPLLDMLIRRLGQSREPFDGLHQLFHKAGLVAENLRKTDMALRHYRSAYELDATDLDTLKGLGRLLFEREDWDRAFKIYQTILVHHRENLGSDQQVEIFHRLGVIKLKVGERSKAHQMFDKVLELDPGHRATLDSLIELHIKQGDWERVVMRKRALISHIEDDAEAFALLVEIGDIQREQLRDPSRAVGAYLEALERRSDSKVVLTHLLRLYNEGQQWEQAVGVLERLIGLEAEPAKLAKLHNTIAVLYRDKLGDVQHAVEHFNSCLKQEPGRLKAFEAVDRLLTEAKDWVGLEKNYRRMLKRVKDSGVGGEELEVMLWRNLGEIYRTRMARHADAAMAFAEASRVLPDNEQLHEIIGELHELAGEHDKAVARHHQLIGISPFRVDSYRALNRLYMGMGKYDEAWCMCSALTFLREAAPEEAQFYQQYKGPTAKLANRAIDNELWTRNILHEWNNLRIGNVFAMLAQFNPYAVTLKDWGVKKKDRHDLSKPLLFNKSFQYAANTLQLAAFTPEVYLKKEQHAGLKNGNTEQPWSLVIGADMLSGKADRDLNFLLGRQLALYRLEHYLAGLGLPTANLKLLFFAAWKLTMPNVNVPIQGDPRQFQQMIEYLDKTIPRPRLVDVQKSIQNLVGRGTDINLSRWVQGVDHTAGRMGLLLCGDLETAARMIKNDPHPISKATPKERIKELVLYSVDPKHFDARKALGVDIGG